MRLLFVGPLKDHPGEFHVVWEDGALIGDIQAVHQMEFQAARLEGQKVGLESGPFTMSDHLQDPRSTIIIAHQVFDKPQIHGDIPPPLEFDPDVVY